MINQKKFNLQPSTEITWLGIMWLGQTGQWQLPLQEQQEIADQAYSLTALLVTRRRWEGLLRQMNFATQVHRTLKPLQSAGSSHFIGKSALQGYTSTPPYNFQIATSDLGEAGHMETYSILPHPISTPTDLDRCLIRGLGGVVGKTSKQPQENGTERKSIYTSMHWNSWQLLEQSPISTFTIHTDNSTAQRVLTKYSTKFRNLLPSLLHQNHICKTHSLQLSALRLPSTLNMVADGLSRVLPLPTEWNLPQIAFKEL